MAKKILYCRDCDAFTLKDKCPKCGKGALSTKPAKYSPEDKYGKYRRMAKKI
ncbi:MAG: RNA-protein complex protein Nop10 [Candidatus Woesearchaeota archaeon]